MGFVTTLHLQASADAALSCKPVRPVSRGGHVFINIDNIDLENLFQYFNILTYYYRY